MTLRSSEDESICQTNNSLNFDNENEDCQFDEWSESDIQSQIECLFCSLIFKSSIEESILHMDTIHGFSLTKFIIDNGRDYKHFLFILMTKTLIDLDFYQQIKLVNFIRIQASENQSLKQIIDSLSTQDFNRDIYLKPFIQEDPMLFGLFRDVLITI